MQEFEFRIPPSVRWSGLDALVESTCIAEGLEVSMKGRLASFPGSVHWHFKRPGERGVLEITSYPRTRRLWASIQAGRRADWIEPCLTKIKTEIENCLMKDIEQEDSQWTA
jgi:hypothetical protein